MARSQNKLRVLSLQFYCYPDEVGGAWKYTHEVNKRLVNRGHRVFLVTCKPADGLPDHEVVDGVQYYRIGVRTSKSFFGLWSAISRKINAILDLSPVDLIYVHNPLVGFLALLNPRLWRVPKVYHFHSLWYEEERINRCAKGSQPAFSLQLELALNIIRFMEWTCFFSAHSVLFLSQYSERKFRDFFPFQKKSLRVIPGGVDVDVFQPPKKNVSEIRQGLKLPADRPIVLTVRRLAARMGLENLVLAASIIAKRSPHLDFMLVIVGHGSLEESLKSLITGQGLQERVRMIGRVDTPVLVSYYQSADLFVIPTALIEGFGLATVEALASGLPVLGTPVGGTVEILQSIDTRWLFANASPEAMADGLEPFLKDPRPFLAMKPRCREVAVALYGWEHVVDKIEEEFNAVLAPSGATR